MGFLSYGIWFAVKAFKANVGEGRTLLLWMFERFLGFARPPRICQARLTVTKVAPLGCSSKEQVSS